MTIMFSRILYLSSSSVYYVHIHTVCPFRVIDDTEFEEEEMFEVYLKTSDNRIVIPENMSSTIVHIVDPEDGTHKF